MSKNKVFLDNLPHKYGFGINKNKLLIDWKNSIGYKVKFIYDDIKGEVEIINYTKNKDNKRYMLSLKYMDNVYIVHTDSFIKGCLGKIVGKITNEHKYQIGDVINNVRSGKLKILEQIRIKTNKGCYIKGYKYKCLNCGNIDTITENNMNNKNGCCICSNNKVSKGVNDMWTTNSEQAKLLANPSDGYKYMQCSDYQVDWKCPECGEIIKNRKISEVNKRGLNCPRCSDKLPYPEKFVFNVLQQLNIEFTYQLSRTTFKWCKDYRYDFYIPSLSIVIEAHGLQHYREGFSRIKSNKKVRNLEEEKLNDKIKKELAIKNGIKEDNYIVIDCSKSELEWIKTSTINSELNNLFDLNEIDWLKCHKFACNSLVKIACDLWSNGIHSTVKIGKIMKLSKNTLQKYLKQGTKIGWCNYDPKEIIKNNSKQNIKQVICLNNMKVFNSIISASKFANLKSSSSITSCCQRKYKYAGKDPITGKYLHWMYYEDYEKLNEKEGDN